MRLISLIGAMLLACSLASPCRAAGTRYGMEYFLWHCLAKDHTYDLSEERAKGLPPGPVSAFHWWGEPADGHYCLSERDDVLARHAKLLAAAGVDFVFIDFTNHDSLAYDRVNLEYLDPLAHLLKVWSSVPDAPKIVPFVPVTASGDLAQEIARRFLAHPKLLFDYQGKPLFLIVNHGGFPTDPGKRAVLEQSFTTRLMWDDNSPAGSWMFISRCAPGFLESGGRQRCNQRVAMRDGAVEQVSVSAAFQRDYMSNPRTAVPRLGGQTFLRQMQRIDDFASVPIVTILGWNQWMAQRGCVRADLSGDPACGSGSSQTIGGNTIFTDEFSPDYSNDFEPGGTMGNAWYRLLSCEIHRRKAGRGGACHL